MEKTYAFNQFYVGKITLKKCSTFFVFLTLVVFVFSQNNTSGLISDFFKILEEYEIKYILLSFTIFINLIGLISSNKKIQKNDSKFIVVKNIIFAFVPIIVITILMQMVNGFFFKSYIDFIYLILPILFCAVVSFYNFDGLIFSLDKLIYVFCISFLLLNYNKLTLTNFMSISFIDSYSPFENGMPIYLVSLELFYIFKKNTFKLSITFILLLLTLKRVCIIFGFINLILLLARKNSKPNRFIYLALLLFLFLTPILLNLFYSDIGANIVSELFDKSINELTLDRFNRIIFVKNNSDKLIYGYGSTNNILSLYGYTIINNRSLHSDFLMLYFDVGFIGVFLFTYFFVHNAKYSYFSLFLIANLSFEMMFNHPLGVGSTDLWIIVYSALMFFNSKTINLNNKKENIYDKKILLYSK